MKVLYHDYYLILASPRGMKLWADKKTIFQTRQLLSQRGRQLIAPMLYN